MMLNYNTIPVNYMEGGLRRYIEEGVRAGSFLNALLENNLKDSFMYADSTNTACIGEWVEWMYYEMPMNAWGSKEIVERYIKSKREE